MVTGKGAGCRRWLRRCRAAVGASLGRALRCRFRRSRCRAVRKHAFKVFACIPQLPVHTCLDVIANGKRICVQKTYIPADEQGQALRRLPRLRRLSHHSRAPQRGEESYTHRLLTGNADSPLKKAAEESNEVAPAAKDVEAARALLAGVLPATEGSHPGMVEKRFAKQQTPLATICATRPPDVVYHLPLCLSATASISKSSPQSPEQPHDRRGAPCRRWVRLQ